MSVLHRGLVLLAMGMMAALLVGCGSNKLGKMEWVQTRTDTPRVGVVYAIRGWSGVFSAGIDNIAKGAREKGVTAHIYMPEQHLELCETIVNKYKNDRNHEPIVLVGHSRGVDASIYIARELKKIGVKVALIAAIDSVDETIVPSNVEICHNYWIHGYFPGTNLLRGIALEKEKGSTGRLYNYYVPKDAPDLIGPLTNHVDLDDQPKLQARIVEHILEVCVERSKWRPRTAPAKP